jgi:hypothetical protein
VASTTANEFGHSGTVNTTAEALRAHAVTAYAGATRSAGANSLINIGVWAAAGSGQVNYAIKADEGGDCAFAGAADKLGFHGTAPIAKQTGVAVTAGGIHAALVALGLIGA